MADSPWLSIIGLGEDGPDGLCPASKSALDSAEIIMGPPRHLSLLTTQKAKRIEWPVPFARGIDDLMALKGKKVAMLVSGDPFWFGAGSTIVQKLDTLEWQAFPGRSTFSLVAARMGWPLEKTLCAGLHAAPLTRLRPALAPGQRAIVLLRDETAVHDLVELLKSASFGASQMTTFSCVGGPRETRATAQADTWTNQSAQHPVCVALEVDGTGAVLPQSSGLPDAVFETDGVMTKRPIRALTLSTLAPRPFEHLWDIGGGSGSISIEWLLSHPSTRATCIEPRADRVSLIRSNADRLGVDRIQIAHGTAPDILSELDPPDVVFIGGGLTEELLGRLVELPSGTRLVANAVTLESQSLLERAQGSFGGDLLRVDISQSAPVGTKRGWKAAYPLVQWSCVV